MGHGGRKGSLYAASQTKLLHVLAKLYITEVGSTAWRRVVVLQFFNIASDSTAGQCDGRYSHLGPACLSAPGCLYVAAGAYLLCCLATAECVVFQSDTFEPLQILYAVLAGMLPYWSTKKEVGGHVRV